MLSNPVKMKMQNTEAEILPNYYFSIYWDIQQDLDSLKQFNVLVLTILQKKE